MRTFMRTEVEILQRRTQLEQEASELRSRLDALAARRGTDQEAQREYDEIAARTVEVEHDCNLLAWVLGEEQE